MPEYGETNATVAAAVTRLRAERRWSYREVADAMPAGPGKLSHVSVRELELGRRRATVDDLTSLAVAFGVSPITFLMPWTTDDRESYIQLSGTPEVLPFGMLAWLQGRAPIHPEDWVDAWKVEGFQRESLPPWAWGKTP